MSSRLFLHDRKLIYDCLCVYSEPEPPSSMVQLHDITDKTTGWIQLVKSLVRVVPIEHPMGPSVIMLLLDDSPLPTKDSVLEVSWYNLFR